MDSSWWHIFLVVTQISNFVLVESLNVYPGHQEVKEKNQVDLLLGQIVQQHMLGCHVTYIAAGAHPRIPYNRIAM